MTADEKARHGILATDIEWPPGSGRWLRPGPVAEARWLGRWPTEGTKGVWSDALWKAACEPATWEPVLPCMPRIGCDVARFGDDWTAFHVQWDGISLLHDRYNGNDTVHTAGRCVELVRWCLDLANNARVPQRAPYTKEQIMVVVDDDGVGGGVTDQLVRQEYFVRRVMAGSDAIRPDLYPNMRCQLWFSAAYQAKIGRMALARLPAETRNRLRVQAMAPIWKLDSAGRRQVETKAETKKRLAGTGMTGSGGSPDDMDALNLAYLPLVDLGPTPDVEIGPKPRPSPYDRLKPTRDSAGSKLGRYQR